MTMRTVVAFALTAAVTGLAVAQPGSKPPPPNVPKATEAATTDTKPDLRKNGNLIANGDFEEGDDTPTHWQQVDGLTTFWVKDSDPAHGKCIKFDTDVLQSQGYEWWAQIARGKARAKDAPAKKPTVEPKYDTLAGLDGVWYWSDYVPIKRGRSYWLTVDVKGPGILTWLVGYPEKGEPTFGSEAPAFLEYLKKAETGKEPDRGRNFEAYLYKYKWKGQMAAGGSNEWKTYSRRMQPFRPTANTPTVKYVRVLIYPFWPPGEYYVDNVRLVEYPEDDD